MKSIEIRIAEIRNIIQNPAWHDVVLDKESAVEFLMCCIHNNSPSIDQNILGKENSDNTEHEPRRPIIKNFCILGVVNSERHNQEYRMTLKNFKY